MHDATTHASAMPDPPQLTPAALPPESAHTPRIPEDPSLSESSRPTDLNISTSDLSSANVLAANHDDDTPPTSAVSSQPGSQETSLSESSVNKQETGEWEQKEIPENRSTSNSQSPAPGAVSGTKRTASGQIKRSSVNGLAEVLSKSDSSHSRTTSTLSNGTNGNVLELSQQLRTKLKYAMIKVQNGWQTRSLDEVESLASQSPRSTVSGFGHFHDPQTLLSPRTAMSRNYQRESSESDSSESVVAVDGRGLFEMGSGQGPPRRALAPPVDIVPSSRRRPTPNSAYQGVNGAHSARQQSSRPLNSQRTPSQNAAREADAVETLLFMASPNNSGYNPPARASQESSLRAEQAFSSQTSPLRAQFSQTSVTSPKRVAFSDDGSVDKAALINRILDDLSDDSDDELEEAFRLAEKSAPATVST